MNALEFANHTTGELEVNFSLRSREEIVAKLRVLADRVEKTEGPRLVLQEAYSADEVPHDNYAFTTLVLKFAEFSKKAQRGTPLYGNSSKCPVDVKGVCV